MKNIKKTKEQKMIEDTKGHSTRHKAKEWPLKNKKIMRVTLISDTHNKHKQITKI